MTHRPAARALALAALAACVAGCGAFAPEPAPAPQPVPEPPNTTPQGAIQRLERTYENLDIAQYTALLTSDFRYTFSSQSDPTLNNTYPNWGKDDETESAHHLFTGFVNAHGDAVPAASRIQVQFINDQYYADPAHSDSATWYVYCPVTQVNLAIDVPVDGGMTTYNISAPHSFYLVRGDAAILDPGQPADSSRWYVRHWDDLSPATPAVGAGGAASAPVAATTWGGMKGAYDR